MSATLDSLGTDVPSVVRRLDAAAGHCYLTFDDGPDPEWTPRVLETLARADVRATFFVIGRLARQSVGLLREIRAAGHVIGNHAFSHRHPWTLTRSRARSEVRHATDAIAQALGERPQWFRPPHGRLGAYLAEAAREEGQRVALWSVSAVDWGPLATPERIRARLSALRAGDIVLMHDGPLRHNRPAHTLQVLPPLLAALTREGPIPAPLPVAATMAA
ncbi:MAG TPA: polysaccharide deacetylase family protein [Steroidobacteraceae bacterium]